LLTVTYVLLKCTVMIRHNTVTTGLVIRNTRVRIPANALFRQKNYTPSTQPVGILGYKRLVHLIPCLCGMGCKRSLVLEMGVRVSVSLIIIIIIRPDIAINELMGRTAIFTNQPLVNLQPSPQCQWQYSFPNVEAMWLLISWYGICSFLYVL